jgi:RNA polymerase sigma-70 factor (ECF subfamily)
VTWAGTIALNLATDWQRKQARRRRLAPQADVEADAVPAPGGDLAVRGAVQRDEAKQALRALDGLPHRMRLAITLRIVEDLPYDVVAGRLDVPVPTARTWVSRGLARLRKKLEVSP